MQFTFEFPVSSNFGRLSKLDGFCPYLSVSVLDCVPLILFLLNGVQLPSIFRQGRIHIATAYAKTH